MVNDCLVSIIIPVYNRKELVCEMINTIINQTYKNWELILVDDGSTDGAFEACQNMANTDHRICVHRRNVESKGATVCRNIGMSFAQGKYIIFFDSDDLLPVFCLQQRVEYMENNPNLDFAIFPTIAFHKKIGDIKFYSGIYYTKSSLKHLIDGLLPFLVVTNMYTHSFIRKNRIKWDENLKFFQDQDFNIQCLLKGANYKYALNAQFDYYYRSVPGSSSISRNLGRKENFEYHIYFINKIHSLPESIVKENLWAIRRRIIYIYKVISDASQRKAIIELNHQNDTFFYYLFKCSDLCYNFLFSLCHLNSKIAFWVSFPYYTIYNKVHLIASAHKAKKKVKKVIEENVVIY